MNYFDDLNFIAVSRSITKRNGSLMKNKNYTIGIMLRGPAIHYQEDHSCLLQTPFLYWSGGPDTPMATWKTPPGAERENLWVDFTGKRAERMVEALDALPHKIYRTHFLYKTEKLCDIFERLRTCYLRKLPFERYYLPLLMEEFMAAAGESILPESPGRKIDQYVEKTALRMYEVPGSSFSLDQLSAEAGVSNEYFRHCFQKQMGISFHQYLLNQRYVFAVKLLQETSLSIGEIAERCGFPTLRQFTFFFKKRSGYSPLQFRQYTI